MPVDLDTLSPKLVDLLLDPVFVVDEAGRFIYASAACQQLLGFAPGELVGRDMIELVHPHDRERTLAAAQRVMQGDSHVNFENRYIHRDGHVVHIMWSARWLEQDRVRIAVARDVTRLKRSEAARGALYRISEAAHSANGVAALCSVIHRVVGELMPADSFYVVLYDDVNDTLSYPYFADESGVAHEPEQLPPGTAIESVIRSGRALLEKGRGAVSETAGAPGPGPDWLGVPLLAGGRVTGAVVVQSRSGIQRYTEEDRDLLQFVSTQIATAIERRQAADRMRHMAHYDALTGLTNRPLFYDRFDVALRRARRDGERVGVLYLDLDDFKSVNDSRGHEAGDRLLCQVARRLAGCVRETDTVARMGGDEFTVLLTNIAGEDAVNVVVENIVKSVSAPFTLNNEAVTISVSIGAAVFPDDGEDAEALLHSADAGMYGMKRSPET